MLSLYAQYILEKTNDMILETENGWATYRYINDDRSVYILDIYVVPEKRRSGEMSKMANEIAYLAKAKGCTEMIGTITPSTKHSTRSLKALLGYGMQLQSSINDFIIFRKDI